jgi:hypothetical protein
VSATVPTNIGGFLPSTIALFHGPAQGTIFSTAIGSKYSPAESAHNFIAIES